MNGQKDDLTSYTKTIINDCINWRKDVLENVFRYQNETKVHKNSFKKIKKIFRKKYPKLSIELKIISLNSKVETFK